MGNLITDRDKMIYLKMISMWAFRYRCISVIWIWKKLKKCEAWQRQKIAWEVEGIQHKIGSLMPYYDLEMPFKIWIYIFFNIVYSQRSKSQFWL